MSKEPFTPKERLPEYQQFINLKASFIRFREAARKYKLPASTLQRWVSKGTVLIESKFEGHSLLLNEADVAYCALIYHRKKENKETARKNTFSPDGTPFKPLPQDLTKR